MKIQRIVLAITMPLGVISLLCLVGYFLALTDLWHELGSPDFWNGEGPAAFEWRFLSWGFYPMLAFHTVFLVVAILTIVHGTRKSVPVPQ